MQTIHDFQFIDLYGKSVNFSDYEGKVMLIVNTASKCGFTPQLDGLEKLYKQYKDQGFEILAFPSDQFGGQEPLNGDAIGEFCQKNYGVSFPIMQKSEVKGNNANEVYKFLGSKIANGKTSSKPMWNFHKYVVDKQGYVQDYFFTTTKPTSNKVVKLIERLLEAK